MNDSGIFLHFTRIELSTFCFIVFGIVWAYTVHVHFNYPDLQDKDDDEC